MTCMLQPNNLTNLTSNQLKPVLLCRLALVFPRLVPRVVREAKLGMVDGGETVCTKFRHCFPQLLGHGVDLAPVGIVLAVLYDGEVDVGELFPEAFEATAIASIAREKHPSRW